MTAPNTAVPADAPEAGAPIPSPQLTEPSGQGTQEPTDAGTATSPSTNVAALHAGFTQKSMALAAIRDEVGLPKTAKDADIIAAIRTLRRPAPAQQFDSPELQQQYERLDEQRWTLVERTYGTDVADSLRHIRDVALSTGDPEEMAAAYWAAREAQGQATAPPPAQQAAAPQDGQQQPAAPAQPTPPSPMEMGTADVNTLGARPLPQSVTEGLVGSGNLLEGVRRLFGGRA